MSFIQSDNSLHFEDFSSVVQQKWSQTWYQHAGESVTVPHPEDVFKRTELQTPNGSSDSVSHVGFSHRSVPHVLVHLQGDSYHIYIIL